MEVLISALLLYNSCCLR